MWRGHGYAHTITKERIFFAYSEHSIWLSLAGSINDEEPFKYTQLEKMIKDFVKLTRAPLRWVIIFHIRD